MQEKRLQEARYLIVDDEWVNIRVLEQMLEECGCENVTGTTNPCEALSLYRSFRPDIVLLDLMMPVLDGFGVMEQLKSVISPKEYLPILVLTADIASNAKRNALAAGAKDFLTKPFDSSELLLRIYNLLETRHLHLQLHNQNQNLEMKVLERTSELKSAHEKILKHMQDVQDSQIEVLDRLARAAEFRDDDTGQHTQRVALASALLAKNLDLGSETVSLIQRAAPLHDVGKISIADGILLKPGRLTYDELMIMRSHAEAGAALLTGGRSELVQMAERIALTHHEHWNGSGYPRGLKGEEIPLEGRILAVADVFDALTHERPYKPAWPIEAALAEISSQSGQQFDPRVVEAFFTLPHEALI